MKIRSVLTAACALSALMLAPRAMRAQTPVRFSGAAALALPVGDLGDAADVGYNLSFRGEGRLQGNWGLRGDLSWDHFGGKGIVDSYSYLGVAANVMHRSSAGRLYEFGGLGIYNSRTNFNSQLDHDDTNLGLQAGFGLDLTPGPHAPFVEFGITNVFTPGASSLWFPVKFGVRF